MILQSKTTKNNKKWPFIPDHQYGILIIGGSGSGKTNALLNLIKEQDDIDKIYFCAKDLSEAKHEFLIKKLEDTGIKRLNYSKAFIECQWMTIMKILMSTTQQEKENFNCV